MSIGLENIEGEWEISTTALQSLSLLWINLQKNQLMFPTPISIKLVYLDLSGLSFYLYSWKQFHEFTREAFLVLTRSQTKLLIC